MLVYLALHSFTIIMLIFKYLVIECQATHSLLSPYFLCLKSMSFLMSAAMASSITGASVRPSFPPFQTFSIALARFTHGLISTQLLDHNKQVRKSVCPCFCLSQCIFLALLSWFCLYVFAIQCVCPPVIRCMTVATKRIKN